MNESKKKVAYCINTSKVNKTLEGKWQSYRVKGNSRKINYLRKPDSLLCNTSVAGQKKKKRLKIMAGFNRLKKKSVWKSDLTTVPSPSKPNKHKATTKNHLEDKPKQLKRKSQLWKLKLITSLTILNYYACDRALEVFIPDWQSR